ncbi:MAG: hypothetical protein EOO70_09855 [Myxococcaceae bacterium]|nr:MAG: hypothetical protein EOO70_09855 [Myxococcaceae bacterium]
MNSFTRTGIAATVVVVLLSGCGGNSSKDGDAKDPAESKPDFAQTHEQWHALLDANTAIGTAQGEVNAASKTFRASSPKGDIEAGLADEIESLESAIDQQEEAFETLADSDEVNTPELKQAWNAFAAKQREYDDFAHPLFVDLPILQQALGNCANLFGEMKKVEIVNNPLGFPKERLKTYTSNAPACTDPLGELTDSENSMLKDYATGFLANHQKRVQLLKDHVAGKVNLNQSSARYKALATADAKLGNKIDPQGRLNALFPRAEMGAFDTSVHETAGVNHESGSPSPSPSS